MHDLEWLKSQILRRINQCDRKNNHRKSDIVAGLMFYAGKMLEPESWGIYSEFINRPLSFNSDYDPLFVQELYRYDETVAEKYRTSAGIEHYIPDPRLSLKKTEYGPMTEENYQIFANIWS